MSRYGVLSKELTAQLFRVEPSHDQYLDYFPCQVTLRSGEIVDRVYLVKHQPYIRAWGVTPEEDSAKKSVLVEDVVSIAESPSRLPPRIADKLYAAGESGMGYCVFTLTLRDGRRVKCVTGNAVDFVTLPGDAGPADVVDAELHTRPHTDAVPGPDYFWCLYDHAL